MYIRVITFFLLFTTPCLPFVSFSKTSTGDYVTAPYMPSVVQITQGDELGFGVIISEEDGKLYIVTANHVVRDVGSVPEYPTPPVFVRFYHDQGGKAVQAELLDPVSEHLDLALLRVDNPPSLKWTAQQYCDDNKENGYRENDWAWFIGKAREWYVPKDVVAGFIEKTPDIDNILLYTSKKVERGTSGAPLITERGLVGIILRDSADGVEAIDIVVVKKFVQEVGKASWDLPFKCEKNLPVLTITPSVDGSRVYIDDNLKGEFGKSHPFKGKFDVGEYQIRVEKEGYLTYTIDRLDLTQDKSLPAQMKRDSKMGTLLTPGDVIQAKYEWGNDIRYSSRSWTVQEFIKRYPGIGFYIPEVNKKLEELLEAGR